MAGFLIRDCMGMSPEEEIFALYTDDEPERQNVTDKWGGQRTANCGRVFRWPSFTAAVHFGEREERDRQHQTCYAGAVTLRMTKGKW
jgi:hypothetical protein